MPVDKAIARPYARAAFAQAFGDKALPDWSDFLSRLAVLAEDDGASRALRAPDIESGKLLELARAVAKPATAEMDNFLTLLVRRRRLVHAAAIASLYEEARKKEEGVVAVRVESAQPLDGGWKETLRSKLAGYFAADVVMDVAVAPELIGGVRVRFKDRVWDMSARGCLRRLAKSLSV